MSAAKQLSHGKVMNPIAVISRCQPSDSNEKRTAIPHVHSSDTIHNGGFRDYGYQTFCV